MNARLLAGAIGVLIGIAATLLVPSQIDRPATPGERIARDLFAVAPMSVEELEKHRRNGFAELQTIDSVLPLPGDSARNEALYAMSRRSTFSELETLAADAFRISEPHARKQALGILFTRMTELDPQAAVALSRSDFYVGARSLQAQVWAVWARNDLRAAIDAAAALEGRNQRSVTQMIFRGVGGAYTPDAMLVEQSLGISPTSANREFYLRELYAMSPEMALEHVVGLDSEKHQREQIQTIASLLAFEDFDYAESFGDLIDDTALRRAYLDKVYERMATEKPAEAIVKHFANRGDGNLTRREEKDLEKLIDLDLEASLAIYAQLQSKNDRQSIGKKIAAKFAATNPERALQWARDQQGDDKLLLAVIEDIAAAEPELAFQAAAELDNYRDSAKLIRKIVTQLSESAPQVAARHIGSIEDDRKRTSAAQTLARNWLKQDAFAALDWVLSTDAATQKSIFAERTAMDEIDLNNAQALVLALPPEHRSTWAARVSKRLVDERSAEAAAQFVNQFSGQQGYDRQMAQLVSNIATKDSALAFQWAERIPPGVARDGAIANIVANQSRNDPAVAAGLLSRIDDPDVRQVSASSIASRWYRSDPAAAMQWIDSMPRGEERDNILMNTVSGFFPGGASNDEMIERIDDPDKREQALFMRAMMNSRQDPDEMLRLLEQVEMPELFRQQIKANMLREAATGR